VVQIYQEALKIYIAYLRLRAGWYFKAICSDVEYNSTLPSPTPDKGMPIDGSACK
jgi:hypothetical protein